MPAAVAFVVCGASPALTQGDGIDCENAMTQGEMNLCAARDYEAAEKELNTAWKDARAAAKKTDDDLPEDLRGAEKALLAAQRGWIAYHDGSCDLSAFEARGGTMEPMVVSGCLETMTRARTKELRDFIQGL